MSIGANGVLKCFERFEHLSLDLGMIYILLHAMEEESLHTPGVRKQHAMEYCFVLCELPAAMAKYVSASSFGCHILNYTGRGGEGEVGRGS